MNSERKKQLTIGLIKPNLANANSYDLITRNLDEVINSDVIRAKLQSGLAPLAYWGTAPTKSPHFAYFLPLMKVRDLIQAGCLVTILLADVHSFLDEGFDSTERVCARTEYYKFIITEMLKVLGVDENDYEICKGSEMQLCPCYMTDLLKFSTLINIHSAQKASNEVVKQEENPKISSLIYPLMQALDQVSLCADIQLGGKDQRKIFSLALDNIGKMGANYNRGSYLINSLIPSLDNKGKMSASNDNGKITFLDSDRTIKKKIKKAFCQERISDITSNAPLAILKLIFFPLLGTVKVQRLEKWGGDKIYNSFGELEQDWLNGSLAAPDLKSMVTNLIISLISPVRDSLSKNMHLYQDAYGKIET